RRARHRLARRRHARRRALRRRARRCCVVVHGADRGRAGPVVADPLWTTNRPCREVAPAVLEKRPRDSNGVREALLRGTRRRRTVTDDGGGGRRRDSPAGCARTGRRGWIAWSCDVAPTSTAPAHRTHPRARGL